MAEADCYSIGIPVYDGVDLLDVSVPFELFNWMAQVEPDIVPTAKQRQVQLVSVDGPTVQTRDGLRLGVDLSCGDCGRLDLLWVPGGDPQRLQQLKCSCQCKTTRSRRSTLATRRWRSHRSIRRGRTAPVLSLAWPTPSARC